jgi:uncharacterized protein DUF87
MADLQLGGQVDPATHQRGDATTKVGSGDLTTHGVIVGMTGSGKTGLGVVLIEECLDAGIPTLLIDPKGDLTNLCLIFPELAPADFEPWVNAGDATNAGASVSEYAAAQAKAWTDGLAGWDITSERLKALKDKADFTIYTPGSQSGVPLNIVGSLQRPAGDADPEIVGDEVEGFVSGLLSLVGIEADPLSSREHILLANLIQHAWSSGASLDLASLVGQVQDPPLKKLGVLELDSFFPAKDRTALAMRINGLLASPSFAAWAAGPPIDIDAMLRTPDGKPRCAIVTTAHLSEEERQFATTLILSKLVTWMRRQSGTTDLRALLYMDEVAGYLPPTAMPPTKKPIMTLMKQARAFGVGVVLSTQNPVDVDYKALSNAGTWMIGRLQTERDRDRLLDGMRAAAGAVDVQAIGSTISGLAKREFVLRRAGKDQPEVFTTRWAMSYLRGPLTREQITTLMADHGDDQGAAPAGGDAAAPSPATTAGSDAVPDTAPAAAAATPVPAADVPNTASDETPVRPAVATGVSVAYVTPGSSVAAAVGGDGATGGRLAAGALVHARVTYKDTRADITHDEELHALVTPLGDSVDLGAAVLVQPEGHVVPDAPDQVVYVLPAAPIKERKWWTDLERAWVDQLVRTRTLTIQVNKELKLYAQVGEAPAAFLARCQAAADQAAATASEVLRDKHSAKRQRLEQQLATAADRVDVLEDQQGGRRNEEMLGTAGDVLGGVARGKSLGKVLGGLLGKLGSVAGRRSRSKQATTRLQAAREKAANLTQQLAELDAELATEIVTVGQDWAAKSAAIEPVAISPTKTNVRVIDLRLVWVPTA